MRSLLISDLHLTDNPRDAYRWKLFEWLAEALVKHNIDNLFILGDLTQNKDYHSAGLVNKIVSAINDLPTDVVILAGNHDGIDPECPYFKFLSRLGNVEYITKQTELIPGYNFIPYSKEPFRFLEAACRHPGYVFLHATVTGAKSENGMEMKGWPREAFGPTPQAKIFSGDIHVPQVIGPVEYVGAPYPVRFGDKFKGRAVMLEDSKQPVSLLIPNIQRAMLTADVRNGFVIPAMLNAGDQVKVRIRLAATEFGDWHDLKKLVVHECMNRGIDLCGVELERIQQEAPKRSLIKKATPALSAQLNPKQMFDAYCLENQLDVDMTEAGRGLLLHTGW